MKMTGALKILEDQQRVLEARVTYRQSCVKKSESTLAGDIVRLTESKDELESIKAAIEKLKLK
jgi:hypothetical protein